MGKNMGRVASSSSYFSRVPFWRCIVQRHNAVHCSRRKLNAPDRLNLKEVPLRELNLMA